jgi:hypothetical protein
MSLFEPVTLLNEEDKSNLFNLSLNQGEDLLSYKNNFKESIGIKRLNLIEQTTGINLGNIEGMDNMNTITPPSNKTLELNKLEDEFNNKLAIYSSVYKEYLNKLAIIKLIIENNILNKEEIIIKHILLLLNKFKLKNL